MSGTGSSFPLPREPIVAADLSLKVSASVFFELLVQTPLVGVRLFSSVVVVCRPSV